MYQFYEHYTDSSAADQHKLTCLLNVEYGGSGYWYLGFLNYNVSTHVGIGIHSQYGGDWGPRLQFNFPIGNVWLSAGYNLEDRVVAGLSGVRLIF